MRALKRLDVAVLIILFFLVRPCFGQDYDTYIDRGIDYAKKDQFDEAISEFTKAIEINPRYVEAYYNRGLAYTLKGQYGKAISDYSKAIEINPRDADAYNNRGVAYFYKRDYEKAWDDVHEAENLGLKVHPGFLKSLP